MAVIDLSALTTNQGFRIDGAAAGDATGFSVSSAGDVNGDGINDVIIGAFAATTVGGATGSSFVIFGKSAGETFGAGLDLATLAPTDGFRIDGLTDGGRFGISVSAAGDVNGDGVDDLIIGAQKADTSYVVFGQTGGFGASFDLNTLDGTNGFRLDGKTASQTGRSVSAAGDVNGDGFDDIIIGAPYNNPTGNLADRQTGASYVVFGKDTGFDPILSLHTSTNADSLRIMGAGSKHQVGYSVSAAGDVNGDGVDDIIIGALEYGAGSGATYIIYGKDGPADFASDIDLSALTATDGVKIIGEAINDKSGVSVSSAGDLNGDGIDDIIIGALYADHLENPDPFNAGAAYVVFGVNGGFGVDPDFSALNGANGFRITRGTTGDWLGFSVSNAGDVNGDGIDDIILGAPRDGAVGYGRGPGASYVIFGKAAGESFAPSLDLATLSDSEGFRINSAAAEDATGAGVSAAGDLNGDGIDDIIVGADSASPQGRTDAGAAYVVFGFRSLGEGDDRVQTGDVGENVDGLGGNDTLLGGAGDDTLFGGAGNDSIAGGAGVNQIDGGSGSDSISFEGDFADYTLLQAVNGGVTISRAGEETTVINVESFSFADQTLTLTEVQAATPVSTTPTEGADLLTGDAGDNLIDGLGGDDTINGLAGDDTLIGGAGDDSLAGGGGVNHIDGGSGNDSVSFDGDFADYTLAEAAGGGVTISRDGEETTVVNVESFAFADQTLTLAEVQAATPVSTTPTEGADLLTGDAGDNLIDGLGGDDTILGLAGDDTLIGGAGDDSIAGGYGVNHIDGGSGNDSISFDGDFADYTLTEAAGGGVTISRDGEETTVVNVESFTFADQTLTYAEILTETPEPGPSTTPTEGADLLTGDADDNLIDGLDGDDTIDGGDGDDTLIGGAGDDSIAGGGGVNHIDGGAGEDTARFDGDFEDYELAEAENGVTLSRTGEQTTVTDVESFDFADQRLSFAQVQDSIAQNGPEEDSNAGSGAGSDTGSDPNTPAGGPTEGPDRLIGDAGANFIFGLGGDDTIMGLDGNDTLRGDPGDDLLIGGAGDDHIRGLAGRDKLKGGAGSDTLKGNGGDDTLIGGAGDDTLNGGGGSDLLKGGGAHDILRGNGGDDALRGNGGNDTLKGGKGNDTLKGGAGADRIFGDKGDDLLKGGKGADVFVFKLKDGDDIIADFTIGEDRIEFRRGIDGFADISITQKGGHTLIEYGEDESIRLRKISADALSEDDFIF